MLFLGLQILDFCVFNRIKWAGFLGRLVQKSHVTHNRNNLEFWPNSICIIQHLVSCCDDTTFFHPSLFIQPHNFLRFFFFSYLSRRSWWNRLGDLLICTARSTGRSWAVLPGCTTGRWSRYMRQYQSIKRWQIGILQPGKGKALGWPNCAFQYLDGILEERWRETIERDNLWGYVVTGQGGVTSDWKRIGLGEMILWRNSYGVFFFFLFFCFVEHCVLLNFFFPNYWQFR